MHLAVRSGNPQMIDVLGDILHDQVLNLLEGPFAKNQVGQFQMSTACGEASICVEDGLIKSHTYMGCR